MSFLGFRYARYDNTSELRIQPHANVPAFSIIPKKLSRYATPIPPKAKIGTRKEISFSLTGNAENGICLILSIVVCIGQLR